MVQQTQPVAQQPVTQPQVNQAQPVAAQPAGQMPAEEKPIWKKWWLWAIVAVVIIGLIIGIILI